ncbi:MAG: nucleotidyltransferase substrate binding protein [Candidatus Sabulitectum sp.]|nr:nucleotidyltransferase substrate binding protein [Candidatus Sabulitectum sp.]
MLAEDVRWKQRYANYLKALDQMKRFMEKGNLSELEEQGMIKSFEYTFELAWKTLKDFLEYSGQTDIYGSRSAIQKAFQLDLIEDGQGWMEMLKSRNKTSHTYNEKTAKEICSAVTSQYYQLFCLLRDKMSSL